MRTIAMLFSLFCFLALGSSAHAQVAQPTVAELQAQILEMQADVARVQAAQPVAQKVNVNSPRRAHYYVDACGVQVLNQPLNGGHTEDMMKLSNNCARTQVAQTDANSRGQMAIDEGAQGVTMTDAMAAAIVSTGGSVNTYADTRKGEFATGAAAIEAARGFGDFDGSTFNGWVGGQAYANALLNGSVPVPMPVVTNPAPATKKTTTAPTTPIPTAKEKADKALTDALKE